MLSTTTEYLNSFKTPSRQITGSIKYIHEGVEYELLASGGLKSFVIERTSPNGKFFGFAVAQKITIEALGVYENIQKGDKLIPSVGIKGATTNVELPNFYVEEINFNKVDLPEPEGPTKKTNSPLSTLRLTPFNASTPPSYRLCTFENSIIINEQSSHISLFTNNTLSY